MSKTKIIRPSADANDMIILTRDTLKSNPSIMEDPSAHDLEYKFY